ncbi:MAG: hypothetical protein K2X27_20580 [Candidatus Obscuribacterales bacterium]|nr:hypothetical protein [Candidatus Obscuribacterales bacterium]
MTQRKSYWLKAMVLARALAEITVLAVLALLPFILLLLNKFSLLHIIVKAAVCLLSPLSLVGLWGLAQLPFKLEIDDSGLRAFSILKKQELNWSEMKALKQSSKFGFRQYVLSHASGELSFPVFFNKAPELIESIRSELPERGFSRSPENQTYKVSRLNFLFELLKQMGEVILAILLFCFWDSLRRAGKSSSEDLLVVFLAASFIAAAVLWKLVNLVLLPQEVVLSRDGMKVKSLFSTANFSWAEIQKLGQNGMLFPEGMSIFVAKKKHLIGSIIDGYDELSEEVSRRAGKSRA